MLTAKEAYTISVKAKETKDLDFQKYVYIEIERAAKLAQFRCTIRTNKISPEVINEVFDELKLSGFNIEPDDTYLNKYEITWF